MNTPTYEGQALAILAKLTEPQSGFTLWQWGPRHKVVKSDIDTINTLIASGYQLVLREAWHFRMSHLLSQCSDVVYAIDDAGNHQLWARSEDIAHVNRYPVTLACTIEEPKPDDQAIHMLQFLPLPRTGEWALVDGGKGELISYHISQLSEKAQLLRHQIGWALVQLAEPATWMSHSDLHTMCVSELHYQRLMTELRSNILAARGKHREELKEVLARLEQAHHDVETLRQSWLKPDWLIQWIEIRRMVQDLAKDYHEHHEHETEKQHAQSLPPMTSAQQTKLPSSNGFRAYVQGYGPGLLRPSLWNSETAYEQQLVTPNGSILKVRGQEDYERKALYEYINGMMGTEGLKHLLILIDSWYIQTGGHERMVDARIAIRQLLMRMGYDHKQADELEERRKLAHAILYFARTWVTSTETRYEEEQRGRGRKKAKGVDWSPLLVIEKMKSSPDGGLDVPDEVKFHLGEDFYEMLFGEHQQYFTLPTAQVLSYHAVRQQQELCLAFYLCNMVLISHQPFVVHFRELLIKSALRREEEIDTDDHRMRDALRVIYANERLERDGLILRSAHDDIDIVLAVELFTDVCTPDRLALASYERITTNYSYLKDASSQELRTKRRKALQRLLDQNLVSPAITFKPGPLLKEKAQRLEERRKKAIDTSERARVARVVKAATKQVRQELAKEQAECK